MLIQTYFDSLTHITFRLLESKPTFIDFAKMEKKDSKTSKPNTKMHSIEIIISEHTEHTNEDQEKIFNPKSMLLIYIDPVFQPWSRHCIVEQPTIE